MVAIHSGFLIENCFEQLLWEIPNAKTFEFSERMVPTKNREIDLCEINICGVMSAFLDRGVPKPTSECAACPSPDGSSARASAKGGEARRPEAGVREAGIPRPSCSSCAQVGCACSRGLQASTRERKVSACLVLVPARPTLPKRALVLPFIGVRRGSRCTMGGVAECYVSSGGELAP